jgi:hypothetical protein
MNQRISAVRPLTTTIVVFVPDILDVFWPQSRRETQEAIMVRGDKLPWVGAG